MKTHAVVVFFEPDYSNKTIKEIGRTPELPYFTALNVYAETPNTASQMFDWDESMPNDKEIQEEHFNRFIKDRVWLDDLFECI